MNNIIVNINCISIDWLIKLILKKLNVNYKSIFDLIKILLDHKNKYKKELLHFLLPLFLKKLINGFT